jgi:signal transduction histidine kinase
VKTTKTKGAILIADDVLANLHVLASMLKQHGYKPRPVTNGALALKAARHSRPDLILLDVKMPDMDGYETCRQIKADPDLAEIPVLFISGLNQPMDKVKAFQAGGVDYITKPFQFEEVAARIGTHLDLSRQKRELRESHNQLQKAQMALRNACAMLEQRVLERTANLLAANTRLQKEVARAENAEKERREVLRRFVTAQEDERRRVATELHDQLGQHLAAVKLWLTQFETSERRTDATIAAVGELQQAVNDIMKEVHRLASELRPVSLNPMGLCAALRRHVSEWSERTRIAADFICDSPNHLGLPSFAENIIYRVVQEALTNVAKHAQATEVCVSLAVHGDRAVATIKDNGNGFDTEAILSHADIRQRLGLLGMQERVDLANGTFEVKSTTGAGTTILVTFPRGAVEQKKAM